jgi:hypothetical protein
MNFEITVHDCSSGRSTYRLFLFDVAVSVKKLPAQVAAFNDVVICHNHAVWCSRPYSTHCEIFQKLASRGARPDD